MKSIALTINGKKIAASPGTSILDAARKNAVFIPTLCDHKELAPYGACRLCIVEEEKTGRIVASCVTPVAEEMVILTDTSRVKGHRKNIIRLMIAEHPESCIVCNKGNRCELRMAAAQLGVAETGLYPMPNYKPFETNNPFIVRDLSKCILCGKCIRADHELVAVGAIDYNDRGFASRPATLHEQPLESSRCTFCGTCVSMCPTGALSPHNTFFTGTPEREAFSICGFCGAGCSLAMGVAGKAEAAVSTSRPGRDVRVEQVVEVNPSEAAGSANGATLCVRGHFAHDYLFSPDRITRPLMKQKNESGDVTLQPVSLDTAITHVAKRLMEIKDRHGPASIGFIGSTKCTNEENYLLQKIARVVFQTNNITTGGAINGHALLRELDRKMPGTGRVNPLSGLESAQAIVTVLADPDHSVPVAGYHIKRAVRNGAPLIVIDPYRTDLAAFGGIWLHPENAGGNPLFPHDAVTALAAQLIVDNGTDRAFLEDAAHDTHGWLEKISAANPDVWARKAGLSPDIVKKAAERLKGKKIAFVLPCDLLERENGREILNGVFNLSLVTGGTGRDHSGFFVLPLENNLAGALDMGCAPDLLPGRRPLDNPAEIQAMEALWETSLNPDPGNDIHNMIEAAEAGTLKALYVMGENLARALPDPERVRAALEKLDFLVVQEIIHNRTAALAHVVLPGAAFSEKEGSFTNMEGRLQSFSPVVSPPGSALPDWAMLAMLARKAGQSWQTDSIETIRREIRQAVPLYSAIGERSGWTTQNASIDDSMAMDATSFAPFPGQSVPESDDRFPFFMLIGNLRWHLGSGTRTSRSARIRASGQVGEVRVSPSDARALGLPLGSESENPAILLVSPFGAISRTYRADPAVPAGHVFVPQGFSGNDVMSLVSLDALKPGGTGWRNVRVRIEKE